MENDLVSVFVSYSHKDTAWLEELRPHLKVLARKHQLRLEIWDDSRIQPGDLWHHEIMQALQSAQAAVLMVSKHFLASDFIYETELPRLLAAVDERDVRLFTLVLSPCLFDDLPELAKYQTVNPPSKPLEGLPKVECETFFVELTRKIEQLVLVGGHGASTADTMPLDAITDLPASARSLAPQEAKANIPAALPGWQRVTVSGADNGDMVFLTIENGRRIEARVTAQQLSLVDELIRTSLRGTQFDPQLGHALCQLLVPLSFEQLLFEANGTVLVLDEASARLPWELLSKDGRAPMNDAPLIREMRMARFNPVNRARHGTALVIGDPRVGAPFPSLPGAAQEAREVSAALGATGFEVAELVESSAREVLTALFSDQWQILHFAGHGVIGLDIGQSDVSGDARRGGEHRKASGLVLGDGLILSAADVEQMRVVPDLMFLNAAHMGVVGIGDDAGDGVSLAKAFAMLGCPAIIAPGWAIDDAAAVTFALTLYRTLLSGENLARSVAAARKATYETHPHVSTWAAYQCYGDPGFVLGGNDDDVAQESAG